jgi:hypothetical protein
MLHCTEFSQKGELLSMQFNQISKIFCGGLEWLEGVLIDGGGGLGI